MVHHTADVFLCQIVHGGTFGEYPANQFMINFTGPLLIRASCVIVKEIRAPASILVWSKFQIYSNKHKKEGGLPPSNRHNVLCTKQYRLYRSAHNKLYGLSHQCACSTSRSNSPLMAPASLFPQTCVYRFQRLFILRLPIKVIVPRSKILLNVKFHYILIIWHEM